VPAAHYIHSVALDFDNAVRPPSLPSSPPRAVARWPTRLDERLGSWLTGNPRGIKNHAKGAVELLRARLARVPTAAACPDPAVESLRATGFADLGEFYERERITRIRDALRAAVEDPELSQIRRTPFARQLLWPASTVPEAIQLLDERVRAIIERYYGGPFKVYKFQLRTNFAAPSRDEGRWGEIYNDYWHVDDRPTSTVKLFVNLCQVGESGGPFQLVELPESRRVVRSGQMRGRARSLDPALLSQPGALRKLVGPAGQAGLATTARALHRAGRVCAGRRRDVATFTFRPSSRHLPDSWYRRFENRGARV
jgi:hypothetical protein